MGGEAIKYLIEVGHPAHVHQFRNMIWALQERGHTVEIAAADKDIALSLLDAYGFDYAVLGQNKSGGLMPRVALIIRSTITLCKTANRFKPDMFISRGSPMMGFVSRCFRKPYICILDSEGARLEARLARLLSDVICTPSCFKKDLGRKQVRFEGYKELAYLHPNYFAPDPSVLDEVGLMRNEKYVVVRFVSWRAVHDLGQSGLEMETKRRLVTELEKHARIFVTSERALPSDFEKYRAPIAPDRMHDLLYYATLLVSDSQTMTTEAAVLGTPAVRCNSFVGPDDMGNFVELEKKYDLIYSFRDSNQALQKALQLLKQPDVKQQWARKRERLLADKIDVTRFMVDFIENYPESFRKYKMAKSNRQ
jgi:hypothetical protein